MAQQPPTSDTLYKLLAYWRAALADSSLSHPTVSKECEQIDIGETDSGWRVTHAPAGWVQETFAASKLTHTGEGDPRKPIPLLLLPALLARASSHGTRRGTSDADAFLVPLCIPCLLTPEGALLADPGRLPWIPRQLLEPSYTEATIGALADLDAFVTRQTKKPERLADVLNMAAELFAEVTGCRLALLARDDDCAPALLDMEGYGVIDGWFGIPYEPPVVARHIIRLYDLLNEEQPATPLLQSLAQLGDRPAVPPMPLGKAEQRMLRIVGHINRSYPLSPSQHEAMIELLGLQEGRILAVNGPPGTGKTTLLQSVVAQEWVIAALEGKPCPIIAATSTNVKAVENVLDSFARMGKDNGHERWLPDIGGFGLFLASASRESEHPTYTSPQEHYFVQFETPAWVAKASAHYLAQASRFATLHGKADTVDRVTIELRNQLRASYQFAQAVIMLRYRIHGAAGDDETVGARTGLTRIISTCRDAIAAAEREIELAQQVMAACTEKQAAEAALHARTLRMIAGAELAWNGYLASWKAVLLDLFAFLPAIKRARNACDRAFLLTSAYTNCRQHREDGVADHFSQLICDEKRRNRAVYADLQQQADTAVACANAARAKKARHEALIADAESLLHDWLTLLDDAYRNWADMPLCALNDELDLHIRAPMFQLADWYWSGCWLVEMDARLREGVQNSKAPQKLEAMLRRFAKLAPCMVSNFHMAPAHFCGWMGKDRPMPLWNTIDLLIVDEAGQVSPEIGAPTFALARRALVVGDVYQIEPIWNVTEGMDRANAAKFGLVTAWDDPHYLDIAQDGYTAAKGNLMHIASRACGLQKFEDVRGLMLTEHRRCVPELISYCNALVYGGRLEPKRATLPAPQRMLPAFGYFALNSRDQKLGRSRKNTYEAQAIVDWLVRQRARLEQHYRDPHTGQPRHISKIVAVITPFSPQANYLSALIRQAMPDTRKKGFGITVGTVHRLQGAEREVVIFSPVYGEGHQGSMFFDDGRNMMNVAVSRAKDSFLVFGNINLFNPQKTGIPSGLLAQHLFTHPENALTCAAEAGHALALSWT